MSGRDGKDEALEVGHARIGEQVERAAGGIGIMVGILEVQVTVAGLEGVRLVARALEQAAHAALLHQRIQPVHAAAHVQVLQVVHVQRGGHGLLGAVIVAAAAGGDKEAALLKRLGEIRIIVVHQLSHGVLVRVHVEDDVVDIRSLFVRGQRSDLGQVRAGLRNGVLLFDRGRDNDDDGQQGEHQCSDVGERRDTVEPFPRDAPAEDQQQHGGEAHKQRAGRHQVAVTPQHVPGQFDLAQGGVDRRVEHEEDEEEDQHGHQRVKRAALHVARAGQEEQKGQQRQRQKEQRRAQPGQRRGLADVHGNQIEHRVQRGQEGIERESFKEFGQ